MRGMAVLTVAAILAVAIPSGAQVRQIPVRMAAPPARPVMMPNRGITFVHPAPPPVRVVDTPARIIRMPAQPPIVQTSPVSPAAVSTTLPLSPVVSTLGGTPISLGQLLNPTPGLGFDFNHLAAINSNLGVQAIIDPLTQHELALALRLSQVQPVVFFGFGGFGGYAEPPVYVQPAQPQIIVLQQPAPQAAPAAEAAPAPVAAAAPAPPVPDIGQFLLVQRDGQVIHAVAFSVVGKNVVYITSDGLRHIIPLDQLDKHQTEQRNAERGTVLHLND
ncbi:MAG: hypothetical protein KGL59_08585 [Acidobacteriota bacterium]|nr:hypothetical protein [Acidobacteriota bacterium]